MNKTKITIIAIIVVFTVSLSNRVNASWNNNQKYIFYLKNQGNYFSTNSISQVQNFNQKIYPGSSGYFDILINTQEYSFNINYSLKFLNLKNKPKNLYFNIDNEIKNSLEDYSNIEGFIENGKEEVIKRVYWSWDYEAEDECIEQNDFTFEMNLIVERKKQNYDGNKLPRTGFEIDVLIGIGLAILVANLLIRIKKEINKENNEINKSFK